MTVPSSPLLIIGYSILSSTLTTKMESSFFFSSDANAGKKSIQIVVIYTDEEFPETLLESTTYMLESDIQLVLRSRASYIESHWILKVLWDGCLFQILGSMYGDLSGLR